MLVSLDAFTGIILDPRIRDWVLLPIFFVMILQGILRQYVSVLLTDRKRTSAESVEQNSLLRRSQMLRAHAHFLPSSAFRMRKRYLIEKEFRPRTSTTEGATPPNPMQDPFAMVGMLKQNMAMIVPNMLLMAWVSYFFSGFVLVRLPFGVGENFKSMLQRGISLNSLDVSYVSSLSWYLIILFGLRGLFSLILGGNNAAADSTKMMEDQMSGGGMQAQPPQQLYNTEKTELEIVDHEWGVPSAEYRLLGETPPAIRYS
jgi:hypothetical protein